MGNPDQPSPTPEELGGQKPKIEGDTDSTNDSSTERPAPSSQEIYEGFLRQREEALGSDNRYFAKEHFGYEVTDEEELMKYYIAHGGALGFRERKEARDQQQDKK